eukprot:CAMPEP_0170462138 /NCGR_PEP_ID=MMETSP0123-20130129/7759_1 /TAXON_ID=182087 /ORGANISM="Favella ehrenbergii, Strain Fehren 1" /LENGTH=126 /DNA_ID=CAMNT_0010727289 /DNA_START=893 /DNA_END=1272 /DNA_ORIENTATION=-
MKPLIWLASPATSTPAIDLIERTSGTKLISLLPEGWPHFPEHDLVRGVTHIVARADHRNVEFLTLVEQLNGFDSADDVSLVYQLKGLSLVNLKAVGRAQHKMVAPYAKAYAVDREGPVVQLKRGAH